MNTETQDWTSALMDASLLGKFDRVSQLIDSGVESNLKDNKGWTAMHFAAAGGYTDIVELLLARGADVNSTTNKNESCLLLAVLSGHIDVVRVLVSAGADVNLTRYDGVSPLHAASRRKYCDVMKMILNRIAEVDVNATEDSTPLVSVIQKTHGERLLAYGAHMISVKNKDNSSLRRYGFNFKVGLLESLVRAFKASGSGFFHLCAKQFSDTVNEFLKFTQVYTKDNVYSVVALFCALWSRYSDEIDGSEFELINLRSFDSCSSLHVASERRFIDTDMVKLLLDNDARIDTRDRLGFTPLHDSAAFQGQDVVKLLLDRGADVHSLANRNESSLLRAASSGHINVVRELISAGADVNLQSNKGISPLHAARQRGFIDVVKMLLENNNQHGTDVNTVDEDGGNTPLHDAVRLGLDAVGLIQLLVQHSAWSESRGGELHPRERKKFWGARSLV